MTNLANPIRNAFLAITLAALASLQVHGFSVRIQTQDQDQVSRTAATDAQATDSPSDANLEFLWSGLVPESIAQLTAMEKHVADIVEQVKPATVNIQVGASQGSGVVVSRDGYVLTAAHVIGRPNQIARITFPDGTVKRARTLGSNGPIDSGMLKIIEDKTDDADDENDNKVKARVRFPYLDMGESASLKEGQWVIAIGHPGGIDPDRGLVVRVGRIIYRSARVLRTDCTLVGGDSGGPLVDMDGNVVGIHSRIGGQLTDNLHVPVDSYSEQWDLLASAQSIGSSSSRPRLGINVVDETNEVKEVPEGPARKAGVQKGDVIIEMDGVKVANKADIARIFKEFKIGDQIEIIVQRGDTEKSLQLKVGSY